MSELDGPELAAAVARVLGKKHVIVWNYGMDRREAVPLDEVPSMLRAGWELASEDRPDLGGAAAWEVHEWAAARHNVVTVTYEGDGEAGRVCMLTHAMSFTGPAIGLGPTDAIALCRAVVALGEA